MIYLTSDTHFGHANIIKYCNRPYKDTYLMDKSLTENWNSIVTPEDTVYHLGDFAFGGISKYLPKLNGNILLIRGNHDRDSDIKGSGINYIQNMDFEYGGYRFKMNHRPVFKEGTPDQFNDREQRAKIDLNNYDWILCGHVHEKWKTFQKNINVGTDIWGFKPITFDDIIETIKEIKE